MPEYIVIAIVVKFEFGKQGGRCEEYDKILYGHGSRDRRVARQGCNRLVEI